MEENLTISTDSPPYKSMDYTLLRETGIARMQELAGLIWTDYNVHDPGLTIWEVLCYAITDAGYRINYSVEDILALPVGDNTDIKNFYTAREILHNRPVTISDLRKLLIDVEVSDPSDTECLFAGIKNAWFTLTNDPEQDFYIHWETSEFSYDPPPVLSQAYKDPRPVSILYDVLLEFDSCETYGDLNDNFLKDEFTITGFADPLMDETVIRIEVEMPRWDGEGVDWEDTDSIRDSIRNITVEAYNLPDGYSLDSYYDTTAQQVLLTGEVDTYPTPTEITGLEVLEQQVNDFIFEESVPGLLYKYRDKVEKVIGILDAAKDRLLANRPLCEDFVRFSALKIEEILLCADIELLPEANVEEVEAEIFFRIADFLAPDINFYSLDEMQAMDKETGQIYTTEELKDEDLPKNLYLTEEIFEGPALDHGFIPDHELQESVLRKVIHVSDLIRIIMGIEGVKAIRDIQIANRPQNNITGIEEKSVYWCLELAIEQSYVPRLNREDSRITYYKDKLPFRADELETELILDQLEDSKRDQKLHDPVLDIKVPRGEHMELADYESIQNEFPLNYGIGEEGLPGSASNHRKATALQLKGFLMFFDQMFANFFQQMEHIRDLFSMNAEKDELGNFRIGRTYYTQPLFDIAPDADSIYVDMGGHAAALEGIAESEDTFHDRRNRFLDHLMARFGEQFTDYALLAYKLDGPKAPENLIEDKLAFLNKYPAISARRGTAFDYRNRDLIWHRDNVSGLEQRAALLTGIDDRQPSSLAFSGAFAIANISVPENPIFGFTISGPGGILVRNVADYGSEDEVLEALERLILTGLHRGHYEIFEENPGEFAFALTDGLHQLAVSETKNYTQDTEDGDAAQDIEALIDVVTSEYYTNPESNRHNLSCPYENYMEAEITTDLLSEPANADPPTYTITYTVYGVPFSTDPADAILTGMFVGEGKAKEVFPVLDVDTGTNTFSVDGDITHLLAFGDTIIISDSATNDGLYKITSISFGATDTTIEVDGIIPADTAPLGNLSFNTDTEEGLLEAAEAKRQEIFEDIVYYGVRRTSYKLVPSAAPFTSPYVFIITNRNGEALATSVAFDFNEQTGLEINNVTGGMATAYDEAGTPLVHNVINAVDDGPFVRVEVSPAPDPAMKHLEITERFAYEADPDAHILSVPGTDLRQELRAGDTVRIEGSTSNDRNYTLMKVSWTGAITRLTVNENIPSDESDGELIYDKSFPVKSIDGNQYLVLGGADETAIEDMISFLDKTFNDHEGMHLLEHVLLRPRTNEPLFVAADETSMTDGLADNGDLSLSLSLALLATTEADQSVTVDGDVALLFPAGAALSLDNAGVNTGDYTVDTASFNGVTGNTTITLNEPIPADSTEEGDLLWHATAAVTGTDAAALTIESTDEVAGLLAEGDVIVLEGSDEAQNDGRYMVQEVTESGGTYSLIIAEKEILIQDAFLEIDLDNECESCRVEDPYSCMASVVLPHWAGRFYDRNFRRLLERTLRVEAPAHVYLKICWISCDQMAEFENRYKRWLLERSRPEPDAVVVSSALADLLDILSRLRNIHPGGTLHDCEEDDTLQNSIILDNSALGKA
ncbi:MAG: hypothetical protein WBB45_15935 [Cyclobacteriaceae bacterium]